MQHPGSQSSQNESAAGAENPGPPLGYPMTQPVAIDLTPTPAGSGTKSNVKSGFAGNTATTVPAKRPEPQRSGPPLPKRPKGRLFIGTIFTLIIVVICMTLYNSLLRYKAYGEVVGRRIQLAVPWQGVIKSMHVRVGDAVKAGQVIAQIDSLQMRQKIEEIDDSLRLERASLASELAMLRWEAEKIRDVRKLSQSDFYDKWSELLWEQSRLADLQMQLRRIEPAYREGAATRERLESLQFQVAGQEKRVQQLAEAVRALKHRTRDDSLELSLEDRVQPSLARIQNLQAELQRTREILRQGDIRTPTAGRIVRLNRFVGEFVDVTTPVAELYVDGSTEVVLYLPQDEALQFPPGRIVELDVESINKQVNCEVNRIGLEMQPAPNSLARFYRQDESLFPVYLRIRGNDADQPWLALGSEVRLPRSQSITFTTIATKVQKWWNASPTKTYATGSEPQIEQSSPPPGSFSPLHQRSDTDAKRTDGRTAAFGRLRMTRTPSEP